MRHRLSGLSTYGLNGQCLGDEHWHKPHWGYGPFTFTFNFAFTLVCRRVGGEKQSHRQRAAVAVRDDVTTASVGAARSTQLSSSVQVRARGTTSSEQLESTRLTGLLQTDAQLEPHRGQRDYNVELAAAEPTTGQWQTTAERQHRSLPTLSTLSSLLLLKFGVTE